MYIYIHIHIYVYTYIYMHMIRGLSSNWAKNGFLELNNIWQLTTLIFFLKFSEKIILSKNVLYVFILPWVKVNEYIYGLISLPAHLLISYQISNNIYKVLFSWFVRYTFFFLNNGSCPIQHAFSFWNGGICIFGYPRRLSN